MFWFGLFLGDGQISLDDIKHALQRHLQPSDEFSIHREQEHFDTDDVMPFLCHNKTTALQSIDTPGRPPSTRNGPTTPTSTATSNLRLTVEMCLQIHPENVHDIDALIEVRLMFSMLHSPV